MNKCAEQFNPVETPLSGINLVEAAAGTGKTYCIQILAARLILEGMLKIEEIVILSFTVDAAAELAKRIRSILEKIVLILEDRIDIADGQALAVLEHDRQVRPDVDDESRLKAVKTALRDFDLANISTINGFCHKLISQYAFESRLSFSTELEGAAGERLRDIMDDWLRQKLYDDKHGTVFNALITPANIYALQPYVLDFNVDIPEYPECDMGALVRKLYECGDVEDILNMLSPDHFRSAAKIISRKKEFIAAYRRRNFRKVFELCPLYTSENLNSSALKAAKGVVYEIVEGEPFFAVCSEITSALQTAEPALAAEALRYARKRFPEVEKEQNFITFADQIRLVDEALQSSLELKVLLQRKFKAGIIDEFQDTDAMQYRIFSTLFEGSNSCMFMVGDPRQAIYRFRGGDIYTYLKAKKTAQQQGRVYRLGVNYRSSVNMVQMVNHLFAGHEDPFNTEDIDFPPLESRPPEDAPELLEHGKPASGAMRFYMLDGAADAVFKACASRILELLSTQSGCTKPDGSALKPDDIAVLVRTHREAALIRHALDILHIPAVCLKSGNVYASFEALELFQVLSAAASPYDRMKVHTALGGRLCGISLAELRAAGEDESSTVLEHGIEVIFRMGDLWRERGFAVMFETFLKEFDVRSKLARLSGGERMLTNLSQLEELLQAMSSRSRLTPEKLLEQFAELICQSAERSASAEEYEELMSNGGSSVKILTIHASKGLQYPVVMLPGLDQLKVPVRLNSDMLYHDGERRMLDLQQSPACRELIKDEIFNELLRLIYVAVTRAEYRCEIFCNPVAAGTPLEWLLSGMKDPEAIPFLPPDFAPGRYEKEKAKSFIDQVVSIPDFTATWQVVSYTFLTRGVNARGSDIPVDHDENLPDHVSAGEKNGTISGRTEQFSPYTCAGGAGFGTALHEILEKLDFASGKAECETAAVQLFSRSGINGSDVDAASGAKWIHGILNSPLKDVNGREFLLSELDEADRVCEMEFCCGLKSFDLDTVRSVLDEYVRGEELALAEWPELWHASLSGGILNGFIDLVFRRDGKYYIVDWKTNKLGDTPAGFAQESLKNAMVHSMYFLQYLLYLVALVRHLRCCQGGVFGEAEYNEFIGGVYYLFVRGMSPDAPGQGVFFARPPWKTVHALEELICSSRE
ncbi:MAG: UvrD-helicase domain-containing protein [Lentisphaeria bacterium]|nr:UvrD-helicase domain-containing protein [Lentisphaeria bacterium]